MSSEQKLSKFLRAIGVILMSITAGFTLLGGAGTTCVALNPTGFSSSMAALASMQWLYIFFVLSGVALGILGIRAVIELIRGKPNAYRFSVVILVIGTILGLVHMVTSRALRGKSMPVDAIVYVTAFTLVVFLIFKIPGIWKIVDFSRGKTPENKTAGGAASILLGILSISIQNLMGATHTWGGINYADAFHLSMWIIGIICFITGLALLSPISLNRFLRHQSVKTQ
jgi:hypothetical protein